MAERPHGPLLRYTLSATRAARLTALRALSRVSRRPVLSGDPRGPVVSMATYGARAATAHIAVETIARGVLRPARLVVTIDGGTPDDVPPGLRRLVARGVELRFSSGLGPHTKYYPLVAGEEALDVPLVTADDDVFYPRSWLRRLVRTHEEDPTAVVCWRARRFGVEDGRPTPYATWRPTAEARRGFDLLPIGMGGVLYPPAMLAELRRRGDAFRDLVPRADDLWLHWVALQAGFPARRLAAASDDFPLIPFTQAASLQVENLGQGRNDGYVAALYTPEDVRRIAAARQEADAARA